MVQVSQPYLTHYVFHYLIDHLELLKKNNLSATPFRKEVLAIFARHDRAIPVSVIEQELDNYNRITLYRTIKTFIEKGIIHEIAITGEAANYAICKDGCTHTGHHHQHLHFKCNSCAAIYCVELSTFPSVDLPGYQVDQLEVQASGICKACNQ